MGWIFTPIGYPALLFCITQFKHLFNLVDKSSLFANQKIDLVRLSFALIRARSSSVLNSFLI